MIGMMSIKDILLLHLFVGVSISLMLGWWAISKNKVRHLFHFGGDDAFSFGNAKEWKKWFAIGLVFEVITSVFYIHTGLFYIEVAYSFMESVPFVIGAFVVDRILMLFFEHDSSRDNIEYKSPVSKEDLDKAAHHAKELAVTGAKVVKDFLKVERPVKVDPSIKREEENSKFADLTKGH